MRTRDEIEARLVKRMAIAFWKSERAERIEVALFDAAPKLRPPQAGFEWEEADPLTTFDLKRFNAVRGYQAQQGRELSRCLKELRLLRREPLAECTDEPEPTLQNEPDEPARRPTTTGLPHDRGSRNEPDGPLESALGDPRLVAGSRMCSVMGVADETSEPPTIRAEPQRGARVD